MTMEFPTTGRATGTGTLAFLATADAEALIARCPNVARLLPEMADALERQTEMAPGLLFDLALLTEEERMLLNEILGNGEVAATVALPDGCGSRDQRKCVRRPLACPLSRQ